MSKHQAIAFGLVLALAGLTTGCGAGDSQAQLRSAIDAKQNELDSCYAKALERNRDTSGSAKVWVNVEKSTGQVKSVELQESQVADQALFVCVENELTTIQLEKAPKVNLKVDYTLQFRPKN